MDNENTYNNYKSTLYASSIAQEPGGSLIIFQEAEKMKLSAPKQVTFWIAVVIAILGVLGILVPSIPVIGGAFAAWLVVIGFVVLAVGNLLEGF